MTVGIFRSRIFTAGRTFLRDGRGVSAVETAFAFPVILAAFFIIVEFANMALTIQVGESAVSSALLRFRDAGELGASAENDIRQGIAAYSFGYLKPSNVSRVPLRPMSRSTPSATRAGRTARARTMRKAPQTRTTAIRPGKLSS